MTNPAFNTQAFADYFKAFGNFKTPNFDFGSLFNAQRRNIEAFTEANQVFAEGLQEITRLHAEAVRQSTEQFLKAAKESFTGGTPEANATRQADFARNLFESTLRNLREITETATKSSYEAFDVLNKRATESFDEVSRATGTHGAAATSSAKKK